MQEDTVLDLNLFLACTWGVGGGGGDDDDDDLLAADLTRVIAFIWRHTPPDDTADSVQSEERLLFIVFHSILFPCLSLGTTTTIFTPQLNRRGPKIWNCTRKSCYFIIRIQVDTASAAQRILQY